MVRFAALLLLAAAPDVPDPPVTTLLACGNSAQTEKVLCRKFAEFYIRSSGFCSVVADLLKDSDKNDAKSKGETGGLVYVCLAGSYGKKDIEEVERRMQLARETRDINAREKSK